MYEKRKKGEQAKFEDRIYDEIWKREGEKKLREE